MPAMSYYNLILQYSAMRDGWKRYATSELFADLTAEQYSGRVAECVQKQNRVTSLEAELEGARNDRDKCFAGMKETSQFIKNAVAGDPAYGPDSSLYESFGYVRKSERKSGLTRRKSAGKDDGKT